MPTRLKGVEGVAVPPSSQASFGPLGPKRLACPGSSSASLRQIRLRLKLTSAQAERLAALPRRQRWRVAALVLGSAFAQLDLGRLVGAQEELRRAGVLLNQGLRACHQDGVVLDASRVMSVVALIENLRGL